MDPDPKFELETYKKIQDFIKTLPLTEPWRGVAAFNILNGFIETALTADSEDPHDIMMALDHMFIQMLEVYKSGGNTDFLLGTSPDVSHSDSTSAVSSDL